MMSRPLSILKGDNKDPANTTYAQALTHASSAPKASSGLQRPSTSSDGYGESHGSPSGQVPQRRGLFFRGDDENILPFARAGAPSPPWKETATLHQDTSPYAPQGMSPYPSRHNGCYRAQSVGYTSSQTLASRQSQPTDPYRAPSIGSISSQVFSSPGSQPVGSYDPQRIGCLSARAQPAVPYDTQPLGSYPPPFSGSPMSPPGPFQIQRTGSFPLQAMSSPLSGPMSRPTRRSSVLNPTAGDFTAPSVSSLTPGVKIAVAKIEGRKDFKKFLAKEDERDHEEGFLEQTFNETLASSAEYSRFEKGLQERRRRYSRNK
ncbi:hypothetical protein FBEOM_6066 [Fusarium beomiforme]|uniref:Uncharacterized protein n=1 Tax=Fusarium beomiforme TaxID=44412 RepID=A0A9P5ALG9_9HYPO|nr:hypothetical protein FBEOM_6066 [Fusarium beomiforme]